MINNETRTNILPTKTIQTSQFSTLMIILFLFTSQPSYSHSKGNELTIYLSADFTGTKASGISIEQGIRTALSENNNQLGSQKVKLEVLNHRGSTPRAKKHLDKYLTDPSALVLFSGLHSPPLLTYRDYINENGILVFSPWAAAGPITRGVSKENWIFRLSIDDTKAGQVITDYAVTMEKVTKPVLLLEETGWGKSNKNTMTKALMDKGLEPLDVKQFNWGLSENNARIILRDIFYIGADAIFLVANAPEGKVIVKAMASLPKEQRLPIFSHWGITGGDFEEVITNDIRSKVSLNFIQTSFSFMSKLSKFQQQVFERSKKLFPDSISRPIDIKAPAGFIHAYDLTKILMSTVKQTELTSDIKLNRIKIRSTLETLDQSVKGLIKTYKKPFSPYSPHSPDAHEALKITDFKMAHYGKNNEILLNKNN